MTELVKALLDPNRPVFLLGDVPPMASTSPGEAQKIASKFLARSRALASDGFIIYDIQDEPSRSGEARPFPFRQLTDPSRYAALVARTSGKDCLVYKCIDDEHFDEWVQTAATEHGHAAINVVGRPSSDGAPKGPSIPVAMAKVRASALHFGCVCIAERHTDEHAASRGRDKPTEHENMMKKQAAGAEWFVSQAVYDAAPTIRLLRDYAAACRQAGLTPKKVVLTFAPCGRPKTMQFLKWLGVRVPEAAERRILDAESPVDESVALCCELLDEILRETRGLGVPLGISVESVSIFKKEIDAVHDLFRKTQAMMLDSRASAWKVTWQSVDDTPADAPAANGQLDKAKAAAVDALAILDVDTLCKAATITAVGAAVSAFSALVMTLMVLRLRK